MKKFLSLIIAFILSVGAFSICAYADGPQLPDFSETGGEFYITDPDNGTLHLYIKNGKILLDDKIIKANKGEEISVTYGERIGIRR